MNQAVTRSSLQEIFREPREKLLSIYTMAGYPRRDSLYHILPALDAAGVDFIEIGIPFSDPLADGPVIQSAGMQALSQGMQPDLLFEQLAGIATRTPIVLMGYLNSVLQYGFERFVKQCRNCGISGLILPDLPVHIWENQYKPITDGQLISMIFLITPHTPSEKIQKIDALSSSFIYAVSSSSTTGNLRAHGTSQYLQDVASMQLQHPVMTGFNIRDRQTFAAATEHTAGGIIGSAFLQHIQEDDSPAHITRFIQSIRP